MAVWVNDDRLRSALGEHSPADVANLLQRAGKVTNDKAEANVGGVPTAGWIELQDHAAQRARVVSRSGAVLLRIELGSEGAEELPRGFEVSTTENDEAQGRQEEVGD